MAGPLSPGLSIRSLPASFFILILDLKTSELTSSLLGCCTPRRQVNAQAECRWPLRSRSLGEEALICKGADHLILPSPSSLCGCLYHLDSYHPSPSLSPSSLHLHQSCLPGILDWMENVPLPPFWHCPRGVHPYPLPHSNLTPVCPVLLGELNSYHASHREYVRLPLLSLCLQFVFSPQPIIYSPSLVSGVP